MKLAAALLTRPVSGPRSQIAIHHRLDLIRVPDVADVGATRVRGAAGGDLRGRLLQHLRAPAADVNLRALGRERLADLLAEPAAAAGDENGLACQRVIAERYPCS